MAGAGSLDGAGAGAGSGAGGHDIIDEQNTAVPECRQAADHEGAGDVGAPPGVAQSRLRRCGPHAPHRGNNRRAAAAGDFPRQQVGLVETPPPLPEPVQRHGHDHIKTLIARDRDREQVAEGSGQSLDPAVFQQVNELAQGSLVGPIRVGRVESVQPQPAKRAPAFLVERMPIQERGAARDAEILRFQRNGCAKAGRTDRNTRDDLEAPVANPARIGVNKRKKGGCYITGSRCDVRDPSTREDPPPS